LKTSIAIVGCGDVGATLAYTLILQPICSEVILVDPKKELLDAQVRDLGDATYRGGSGVKVRAGDHKDAGQADIVVITAGAKQKPGPLYIQFCVTELARSIDPRYRLFLRHKSPAQPSAHQC